MTEHLPIYAIVPCFNEATMIRETLSRLLEKGYTIVVVDDASTDSTRAMLTGMPVHYIRHKVNLGQGAALQTGIGYALKKGAGFIVTFDADGQHDVEDISKMLGLLQKENAGIVFGSRFMTGAVTNAGIVRRALLRVARLANYLASGILLSDANNGLRVMTKEAARLVQITENRSTHSAQIQSLVKRNGIRYAECPVNISYSEYSKSKGIRNVTSIRILYELILFKIFR